MLLLFRANFKAYSSKFFFSVIKWKIVEIIPLYHAKEASIFILFPYKYSNSFLPSIHLNYGYKTEIGKTRLGGIALQKH